MELRHLRHLVAVVEAGSLGRAALQLNISEPALSKSIRALEAKLGVTLLDRGPRGMIPTVFGTTLYEHARLVMSELQQAVGAIDEIRGAAAGVVRLGAQPSAGGYLLPRAVARFQEQRPSVKVVLTVGTTDLITMLRQGDLDFVVLSPGPDFHEPDLAATALGDDLSGIIVAAGHPLLVPRPLELDDLRPVHWILPRRPDPLRLAFDGFFLQAGQEPPPVHTEAAAELFIKVCLMEQGWASFMPRRLFAPELKAGTLAWIDDPRFQLRRRVLALRRRRGSLSPVGRAFLSELQAAMREEV